MLLSNVDVQLVNGYSHLRFQIKRDNQVNKHFHAQTDAETEKDCRICACFVTELTNEHNPYKHETKHSSHIPRRKSRKATKAKPRSKDTQAFYGVFADNY
eukprot:3706609-Amphidinium_carterae.1